MPLGKVVSALRTIVLRGLLAVSIFVLLYVGYGHVASMITTHEHRLATYDVNLGSIEGRDRFGVEVHGPVRHRIEGGALIVDGTASEHGRAGVRFTGPEQSLDDVISARVRFRVLTPGAYDVYVGLERAHAEVGGESRRVVAVMHVGKNAPPTFAIEGDLNTQGPRRLFDRKSPVPTDVTTDGGVDDQGHTLALDFMAYIRSVFGAIDGVTTGSEQVFWYMGERVRLVFGVEAREPGATINVAFLEASYEQHDRPSRLASFDDRFTGKLIDPRRWVTMLPDGVKGESSAIIEPGVGLHIHARSKGEVTFQPGLVLLTQPTTLDSFRISARVDIRTLERCAFVVGVVGSGFTPPRFLDAVIHDEKGKLDGVSIGHWSGDGQVNFQLFTDPWTAGETALEIRYDVGPGEIEVWMNGRRQLRQKFDLLPGDTTQIRVGVQLQGPDAVADVVIRDVRFDR